MTSGKYTELPEPETAIATNPRPALLILWPCEICGAFLGYRRREGHMTRIFIYLQAQVSPCPADGPRILIETTQGIDRVKCSCCGHEQEWHISRAGMEDLLKQWRKGREVGNV